MKNKYSKPHSLTTDTRLSQSHIFNNSVLNRTNLSTSSQKPNVNQIQKNIQYSQIKETQFLQIKNNQLMEKVNKMKQKIEELQQNKKYLLGINQKYVNVINQYYRDLQASQPSKKAFKSKDMELTKHKENLSDKLNEDQLNKIKNYHKNCLSNFDSQQADFLKIFANLQKNHRNLVKHCLVMEDQINNYKNEMANYNQIKAQLYAVNHTNVTDLIEELRDNSRQNKQLKMDNNRLNFQLQKSVNECEKLKRASQKQAKVSSTNSNEAEKLRSQINSIRQESMDNEREYEAKIYELNIKVEKLQKQLRREDSQVRRNYQKRKQIEIQQVQKVHQNCKLKQNIAELLNFKKYSMLSLDRSFCVKSKNKSQQ